MRPGNTVSKGFWRGKRVLVTGSGGFIGSHVAERLAEEGAQVRALVHYNSLGSRGWLQNSAFASELEFYAGDVCDRDSMKRAVADREFVFHLAALIAIPYSYQAPESYVRTNVIGTLNVLQAALESGTTLRVIHTSTSEVYGTAQRVPITEDHPLQGQSPYSASKIGADKITESFWLSFGLRATTVRPFNTFGPRQSARAVIPTIISQFLEDRPARLGSLTPTRDLNFVSDIVSGFLAAAESDASIGKTVNLGTGREISIGDLAALIAKEMGIEPRLELEEQRLRPENSEVQRLLASNQLAQDLLGWSPQVTLEEGIARTVEWIKANRGAFRPDTFAV